MKTHVLVTVARDGEIQDTAWIPWLTVEEMAERYPAVRAALERRKAMSEASGLNAM